MAVKVVAARCRAAAGAVGGANSPWANLWGIEHQTKNSYKAVSNTVAVVL